MDDDQLINNERERGTEREVINKNKEKRRNKIQERRFCQVVRPEDNSEK